MNPSQAREKIEALRKTLHQHNYQYYVRSDPAISDFEFDRLMAELQVLEKAYPQFFDENSPSQRVGSDLNVEFKSYPHAFPMRRVIGGRLCRGV